MYGYKLSASESGSRKVDILKVYIRRNDHAQKLQARDSR